MNHGTLTCYKRGCRCHDCRMVSNNYSKRLKYDHDHGHKRIVSTRVVHKHLEWLRSQGMSWSDIATAAGYTSSTVISRMMRRDKIRKSTEARILSIKPNRSDGNSLVDSAGSSRRLQALSYAGWPMVHVAGLLGVSESVVSDIRGGRYPTTRAYMANDIARVYESLAYSDGGSVRAKNRALSRGWAPPAAWDDIDDPKAKPYGVRK